MSLVISFTDVIIITLCSLFGYLGYRAGFYDSVLALTGFYLSFTLSLLLMRYTAGFFSFVLELPPEMSVLFGFSFVFGLLMLGHVFFQKWMHDMIKMQVETWFDQISGALLGFYRGFLIVSLLVLGFSCLPLPQTIAYTESRSPFVRRVKCFLPLNYNYFRKLIPFLPGFEQNLAAALKRTLGPEDRALAAWQRLASCTLPPEQLDQIP